MTLTTGSYTLVTGKTISKIFQALCRKAAVILSTIRLSLNLCTFSRSEPLNYLGKTMVILDDTHHTVFPADDCELADYHQTTLKRVHLFFANDGNTVFAVRHVPSHWMQ